LDLKIRLSGLACTRAVWEKRAFDPCYEDPDASFHRPKLSYTLYGGG
jgi:hypothetical protein